jgi:zinc protease
MSTSSVGSRLVLSVCFVLAGCGGHAASGTAVPPIGVATPAFDDQPLPLDPSVRSGVLANGLSYFVRANAEPLKKATLRLVVNAGSVLENDDERGLAHVVEHT